MKKNQVPNQTRELLIDKKTILLYSFYLAIGSVSIFASMVALNTSYQGLIWSYSERYIINSFVLVLVLFISGILLIIACVKLLQKRQSARLLGFVGTCFLIAYSLFILLIDRYISYTLVYILMLLVLFVLIMIGTIFIYKKASSRV